MKTPEEKYMHDPEYRHLVDTMERLIHDARFTPSEIREAGIFASIRYEMTHIRQSTIDPRITDALSTLDRHFMSKDGRR